VNASWQSVSSSTHLLAGNASGTEEFQTFASPKQYCRLEDAFDHEQHNVNSVGRLPTKSSGRVAHGICNV